MVGFSEAVAAVNQNYHCRSSVTEAGSRRVLALLFGLINFARQNV